MPKKPKAKSEAAEYKPLRKLVDVRYDGPSHRLNVGGKLVERGNTVRLDEATAKLLLGQVGIEITLIEGVEPDGNAV